MMTLLVATIQGIGARREVQKQPVYAGRSPEEACQRVAGVPDRISTSRDGHDPS